MSSSNPLPKSDPWYSAPPTFSTSQLGTILRFRTAPNRFSSASAVYNILFRTTDSNYNPSFAVTTLLVPKNPKLEALLSYHLPYNTLDVNSSPSYVLTTDEIWESTRNDVGMVLAEGWYVSVPDHEGPLAAMGDGLVAGHATLDSVRACLHAGFGMSIEDTRVAFWGYSGGALAAGWAAELQPHYAPELSGSCAGAALGGLPPDITVVRNSSGGPFAGQTVFMVLGATVYSLEAEREVVEHLIPEKKDDFLKAKEMDVMTLFATFANQDIFSYFTNGTGILDLPAISSSLKRKGRLGHHGVPEMPLFLYHSVEDELTFVKLTDALVEKWKWCGAKSVLYERNAVGDHLAEARNRHRDAMEWLRKALEGRLEMGEGIVMRDVSVEAAG